MSHSYNRFSLLDSVGEFYDLQQRPTKKARTETRNQRIFEIAAGHDQQKYLIMSHQEEGKMLTKLTPFGVQKGLEGITTAIQDVQKLRSGDLLILAKTKNAAESLKKATNLGGIAKIKVTEHPFLNNSKGLVFSYDLLDLSEEEITQGLQNQNVIETRRIKKWSEGKLVDTPALVLTFANAQIPETIKAGYILLKVKLFIPNPLRCTVCQKFGHPKKRCNGTPTCPKCSKCIPLGHDSIPCDGAKCINCQEEHFAYSRDCAVYKKEAEIVKIKTVDRISHREARDKYYRQHANTTGVKIGHTTKSFADILKNNSSGNSIKQTKLTSAPTTEAMDTQETSQHSKTEATKSTETTQKKTGIHTSDFPSTSTDVNTAIIQTNLTHQHPITPHSSSTHKTHHMSTHSEENPFTPEPSTSIPNQKIAYRRPNQIQKAKRSTSKETLFDQHRAAECDVHQLSQTSNKNTLHPRTKLNEIEDFILYSDERQG